MNVIFSIPPGNIDEQEAAVNRRFETDPHARTIDEVQAEEFFATAYGLSSLQPVAMRRVIGDPPFPVSHMTAAGRRKLILYALKMWALPGQRKSWADFRRVVALGSLPSLDRGAERMTLATIRHAYEQKITAVWIACMVRSLGWNVQELLADLGPTAQQEYRICLALAQLLMSELHSPTARTRPSTTGQADLKRNLKHRESMVRSQQHDIASEEERQRVWQQLAHQAEEAQQQEVGKARAQATAAQEALTRRLAQHQQELGAIEARHAAEMQRLRGRLARDQTDFSAALVERARTTGGTPLAGCRVKVTGRSEDQPGYRLLVESLGGRLVQDGSDLTVCPDAPGLAAFEMALRQLCLETGA